MKEHGKVEAVRSVPDDGNPGVVTISIVSCQMTTPPRRSMTEKFSMFFHNFKSGELQYCRIKSVNIMVLISNKMKREKASTSVYASYYP
jgi:hypothetical protein